MKAKLLDRIVVEDNIILYYTTYSKIVFKYFIPFIKTIISEYIDRYSS